MGLFLACVCLCVILHVQVCVCVGRRGGGGRRGKRSGGRGDECDF